MHQVTASDVPEEDLPGTIAAALRNEPRRVVLVLDNLHEVVSPEVHSGLLRLVAHPPPSLLLLITTRRDPPWPLAQLRLAGLVAEVRTSDLAFRPDEAAALFAQLMVDVDPSQLDRLIDRTEGWAAGLRLVALHLKSVDDVDTAVAAFSGDDHSVAGYLLTEVLERQSPELLGFLEKISVVDLVCADLADSLTGRQDGAAMLADIAASHLFMQALGRPGRWYRLHRLIADILRARPGGRRERRDLHRRAAEWFRRNDMPLDAIRSAIAGRIWSLAADYAGTYTLALAMGGSWPGARTGADGDPRHGAGRARRARRRARRRPRGVRFRHRGRSARRERAGCGRQASTPAGIPCADAAGSDRRRARAHHRGLGGDGRVLPEGARRAVGAGRAGDGRRPARAGRGEQQPRDRRVLGR